MFVRDELTEKVFGLFEDGWQYVFVEMFLTFSESVWGGIKVQENGWKGKQRGYARGETGEGAGMLWEQDDGTSFG